MESGEVPQELNVGKCVLVPKVKKDVQVQYPSINEQGGDSLKASQYRPITIPSNILRLITIRMCERMTKISEDNGFLGEEQFGFRRGRSTVDAALVVTTLIQKAKKKR